MNLSSLPIEDLEHNLDLAKQDWRTYRKQLGLRADDETFQQEYLVWKLQQTNNRAFKLVEELDFQKE